MRPIIFVTSQSLACGSVLAESAMLTKAEKETPHLVIGEAPQPPEKTVMELKLRLLKPIYIDTWMLKQSAYERANPNQPWYAKFQKRRGRK